MNLIHLPSRKDWAEHNTVLLDLIDHASIAPGVKGKRLAAAITKTYTSYGVNSYKTSPLQLKYAADKYKIYLHAEIEALSRATRRTKGSVEGASAFVIRLSAKGELASAKPCEGCMAALFAFGIKEVYYS